MKIKLTQGLEALVDSDDYERISIHKWFTKMENMRHSAHKFGYKR